MKFEFPDLFPQSLIPQIPRIPRILFDRVRLEGSEPPLSERVLLRCALTTSQGVPIITYALPLYYGSNS